MPRRTRPNAKPTPTYVQICVCPLDCFSAAGAPAPDSGRLRTAPRESKPGVVLGCGSLASAVGAAIGAAAARGGAAPVVVVGATTAGAGTSTLRAPVLRSTLAVSVRPESASAPTAGAPGCEARCPGR